MTARECDELQRELLVEQIKYFRAANRAREREQHERELDEFLASQWGYPRCLYRRR